MDTIRNCPGCQKLLDASMPEGLCPECLLKAGLGTGVDMGPDSQPESGQTSFVAPSLEEVARLFPQVEMLGFIGQGGMGAVYKTRQKSLERVVALKILPPGIGKDPAFAERFTCEAKALAKLNHPGIVTLYEFGRADGLFFFLMEFVDGVSLRHLLEVERISAREALAIVPQICDALQYAHDQGIVHRDIKPENILLDRQGRVKVADFGLAKLVGTEGEPSAAGGGVAGSAVLTEAGKVMGTPQYMAPEQRQHPTEVDHRADIYSLGVVFYQMLTGELPGKPIEPPSRKVQVDVRLDEVVLRALEKEPARRYQQVSQVRTAVETIAHTPSAASGQPGLAAVPSVSPSSAQPRGGWPLPLVGVRNGQRAIHWPGLILFAALLVVVAGGLSLVFYRLLLVKSSLGLVTGLLAGFILLGLKLKQAWTTPVERLPRLDTAGAPGPLPAPIFSSRSAKFSLAIAIFGVLIVLGAIANFNFVLGVEKTAMLICGAIVLAAGCVGLALAMHGAAPLVAPEPPGLGGDATRRRPVWDRIAVVLLITAALVTGYLLMSYLARVKLESMRQATRGAEEATLADAASANRVLEVRCEDRKATIRAELDDKHKLRLFVGDDLHGWSSQWTGSKSVTATVEASSQIKMEDGSLGRGLIFQARGGRQYIAITPDGPVPYGEVVFRPNSGITNENGTFTFADIRQSDGTMVPISICVRPVVSKSPDKRGFGPVIERVITTFDADGQGFVFFDLETGNSFKPPFPLTFHRNQGPAFVELTPELKQWIEAQDVDLLLHLGERNWDLMTLEMRESLETQRYEWETSLPEEVIVVFAENDPDHLVRSEVPDARFGYSYQIRFSQLKAFRTRRNTMGIYQFRGLDNTTTRGVRLRYKLVREAGETAQSTGGDPRSRTFILRHMLASEMADDLRQILLGRFGMEARPAPDNMQLTVTAPPEVLNRVSTFVAVTDWPERIAPGPDYYYPREDVEQAGRSFFYACSIEDIEGASRMLSPQVLAELKGAKLTAHGVLGEEKDVELVGQLRGNWVGKEAAVRKVVDAWNLFPLRRLQAKGNFSISFGPRYFASVAFEGAPEEWVELSFIPDRSRMTNTKNDSGPEGPLMIDTLPPWLKMNGASTSWQLGFRAKEEWEDAGTSTPEATLQTLLWAAREHDLDGFDRVVFMPRKPDDDWSHTNDVPHVIGRVKQCSGVTIEDVKYDGPAVAVIKIDINGIPANQVAMSKDVRMIQIGTEWKCDYQHDSLAAFKTREIRLLPKSSAGDENK